MATMITSDEPIPFSLQQGKAQLTGRGLKSIFLERDRALMKKPIELVMFDLDGTLADTGQDLADAVNHTRDHFDLEPLPETLSPYSRGPRGRTSAKTFVARR